MQEFLLTDEIVDRVKVEAMDLDENKLPQRVIILFSPLY